MSVVRSRRPSRPTFVADALEPRRLLAAGFQIEMAFESSVSSAVRTVIQQAAAKWQTVITGDLPDAGSGGWGGPVDDVRVRARVISIDGGGGGVAQARPTFIRTASSGSRLPIAGEIEIDTADVAALTSAGTLDDVVTHEIGHVLGFGTLWATIGGLTSGLGGSDPRFLGVNATREYRALGGTGSGVPLENTGGTGTRDTHWRESTFDRELLTGIIDTGTNPLSRVTVGQFADLGYTVNYAAADGYTLPGVTQPTTGSIRGTVFNDVDGDGNRDGGDAGVSGRQVYSDANNNSTRDSNEPITTTDSSGNYTLGGLSAGTYKVRQILPGGQRQTTPANGFGQNVTLSSGQNAGGVNFGSQSSGTTGGGGGSIRGRVFVDTNRNGRQDNGEAGRDGRRVYLDLDNDVVQDGNEPVVSANASGDYVFTGLSAGTYKVRQLLPAGWVQTSPSNGFGNNVTLSSGQTVSGVNFGAYQASAFAFASARVEPVTRTSRVFSDVFVG